MKDANAAMTLLEDDLKKFSGSERDSNPRPLCYQPITIEFIYFSRVLRPLNL